MKSWQEKGYVTHFMTGIAWGEYQDYFTGQWDGKRHLDEGQVDQQGDTIWHGRMVPYIVPTMNYLNYMKEEHIKKVIDAGIDAIYLEEPEFWARAGYSDAFKRGSGKNITDLSGGPTRISENAYLSNKLKYYLYYRALDECFTFAKQYGKGKGMNVRCYVPTIPSSIIRNGKLSVPRRVWHHYPVLTDILHRYGQEHPVNQIIIMAVQKNGFSKPPFGIRIDGIDDIVNGRKMIFLTDPIEDWPRDWGDIKRIIRLLSRLNYCIHVLIITK